jgi:putative membrane protein insertion efficiency factor
MLYQYGISPLLRSRCRFLPTCSSYGIEAIREWGGLYGLKLLILRLLKCHPWGASGHDPVPLVRDKDVSR